MILNVTFPVTQFHHVSAGVFNSYYKNSNKILNGKKNLLPSEINNTLLLEQHLHLTENRAPCVTFCKVDSEHILQSLFIQCLYSPIIE